MVCLTTYPLHGKAAARGWGGGWVVGGDRGIYIEWKKNGGMWKDT